METLEDDQVYRKNEKQINQEHGTYCSTKLRADFISMHFLA